MSDHTVTRIELVERAHALVPFLSERAEETDRNRALLPDVHRRLSDAGLFSIMLAPRLGGAGLDIAAHLEVASILAQGCGSSAWVQCLIGYQNFLVGLYPEQAQDDVLSAGPLFTGLVMGPTTTAKRVDGGVVMSGSWPYVSGVDQAKWVMLSGLDPDAPDGQRRILTCLMPRANGTIKDDWFMLGLRGTGSKTVSFEDEFVPDHRVLCFKEVEEGGSPGAAVNEGPFYTGLPNSTMFAMIVSGPTVGLAECAIDAYRKRLASRTNARMPSAQTEWPASQIRLGRAVSRCEAARALMIATVDNFMIEVNSGNPISLKARVKYRMTIVEILRTCTEIVYELVLDAGTGAMADGAVLQRVFRDIHVLRSHFVLTPEFAAVNAGRAELDLGPTGPFV